MKLENHKLEKTEDKESLMFKIEEKLQNASTRRENLIEQVKTTAAQSYTQKSAQKDEWAYEPSLTDFISISPTLIKPKQSLTLLDALQLFLWAYKQRLFFSRCRMIIPQQL